MRATYRYFFSIFPARFLLFLSVLPGMILFLATGLAAASSLAVYVNGEPVEMTVSPALKEGRVMVPLNCLVVPLGGRVEWNSPESITFMAVGKEVSLFLDSRTARIQGQALALDVAPYEQHGQIMVSLNFLVDVLGLRMTWDTEARALKIESAVKRENAGKTSPDTITEERAKKHPGVLLAKSNEKDHFDVALEGGVKESLGASLAGEATENRTEPLLPADEGGKKAGGSLTEETSAKSDSLPGKDTLGKEHSLSEEALRVNCRLLTEDALAKNDARWTEDAFRENGGLSTTGVGEESGGSPCRNCGEKNGDLPIDDAREENAHSPTTGEAVEEGARLLTAEVEKKQDNLPFEDTGQNEPHTFLEEEGSTAGFLRELQSRGKGSETALREIQTDGAGLQEIDVTGEVQVEEAQGKPTKPVASLRQIKVSDVQGRQRIDLLTDAPVTAKPLLLTHPPRLVLDIADVVVDVVDDEIYVGKGVIHRIRLSQFQEETARVVVDLTQPTGYKVVTLRNAPGMAVILNARVGRVMLMRQEDTVQLNIETSAAIQYRVYSLQDPDRLVVDLADSTLAGEPVDTSISDPAISRLRVSQYTPTSTRIVLELNRPLAVKNTEGRAEKGLVRLVFEDESWLEATLAASSSGEEHGEPDVAWTVRRQPGSFGAGENEHEKKEVKELPADEERSVEPGERLESELLPVESELLLEPEIAKAPEAGLFATGKPAEFSTRAGTSNPPTTAEAQKAIESKPANLVDNSRLPVEDDSSNVPVEKWLDLVPEWILPAAWRALEDRSIVIDAGHGGLQPGAPGVKGIWEKDFNLSVALRLGEILETAGARVAYTRKRDTTVSLRARVDTAHKAEADVFISIHANASLGRDATGTETLYYGKVKENERLARLIQQALVEELRLPDRGIKERGDLYILRHSRVPSVLVEVGFLDHEEEGAFLLTTEARDKAAIGLTRGIAHFFLGTETLSPVGLPDSSDDSSKPSISSECSPLGMSATAGEVQNSPSTGGEDSPSQTSTPPQASVPTQISESAKITIPTQISASPETSVPSQTSFPSDTEAEAEGDGSDRKAKTVVDPGGAVSQDGKPESGPAPSQPTGGELIAN